MLIEIIILRSCVRASLDINCYIYQQDATRLVVFIIINALHVSGVYRPSSGARET
jgi:hypothetical protein